MANTLELQIIVNDNGSIVVKRLNQAIAETGRETRTTSDALERMASNFGKIIAGAAGTAAAYLSLRAAYRTISDLVSKTAQAGEQMLLTQQRTGMAVDSINALNVAARFTNTNLDVVSRSMKFFSMAVMSAGEESKESLMIFKQLGIQVMTTSGQFRPMDDLFFEAGKRLGEMRDQTLRTALASRLLGRTTSELLPVLLQVGQGKENLIQKAKELGIYWDNLSIRQGSKLEETLKELKMVSQGVAETIGRAMIPALQPLASQLVEIGKGAVAWVEANKELIMVNVAGWAGVMLDAIKTLTPWVRDIALYFADAARGAAVFLGLGSSAQAQQIGIEQRLLTRQTTPAAIQARLDAIRQILRENSALAAAEAQASELTLSTGGMTMFSTTGRRTISRYEPDYLRELKTEEEALVAVQKRLSEGLLNLGDSARRAGEDISNLIAPVKKLKEELQPDKELMEAWIKFFQVDMAGVPKALEDIREKTVEVARAQAEQNFELEEYIKIWREKQTLREIEQMARVAVTAGEAAAEYRNLNIEVKKSVNIFASMFDVLGALSNLMTQFGISIGGGVQRFLGSISAFRQLTQSIGQIRQAGAGGILEFLGLRAPGQGGAVAGGWRSMLGGMAPFHRRRDRRPGRAVFGRRDGHCRAEPIGSWHGRGRCGAHGLATAAIVGGVNGLPILAGLLFARRHPPQSIFREMKGYARGGLQPYGTVPMELMRSAGGARALWPIRGLCRGLWLLLRPGLRLRYWSDICRKGHALGLDWPTWRHSLTKLTAYHIKRLVWRLI